MITVATLIAAGVAPTQARLFADQLTAACARFGIDTPARMGAFVGQCMVESQLFTKTEENCYWSDAERICRFFPNEVPSVSAALGLVRNPRALASVVYAGKDGNGDAASGDGWTYRGRGLLQITGRGNYSDASTELGKPYVDNPGMVAQPEDAALTAAWFWNCHKLNLLADAGLITGITRAVNGPAMDQLARRQALTEQAVAAFS